MKKNRTVVMTVRVTEEEAKALRKFAEEHSLSISSLIRRCVFRSVKPRVTYQSAYGTASNAGANFNFTSST